MFEAIIPIVEAGLIAAVYGGYAYLMKKLPDPSGTEFEAQKFIGTVIVAAGVGAFMFYMGLPVNEASVVGALATIGAVEVGQKIVKPIFNWLKEKMDY